MTKEQEEARDKIVREIMTLYFSGYDGPFIGKEIEPLFNAIRNYHKLLEEDGTG